MIPVDLAAALASWSALVRPPSVAPADLLEPLCPLCHASCVRDALPTGAVLPHPFVHPLVEELERLTTSRLGEAFVPSPEVLDLVALVRDGVIVDVAGAADMIVACLEAYVDQCLGAFSDEFGGSAWRGGV